jgi:hypothetical protein
MLLIFTWYYKKGNRDKTILFGKIILAMLLIYLAYMTTKIHLEIVWPFVALHFYWIGEIVLKSKKSKL